jgi:ABC-type glutathione transport system ATPase component
MLKLDGVSKVYKVGTFGGKRLLAVNNVSFDVQDSEVVSLIGESGSGKTTIGKMILHLAPITSGTIGLDGVDVSKLKGNALKEYYRKVQGVFQDPFSSYNPIFKADRIFRTIREEFFPGIDNGEWNTKIDSSLSAVGLNPDEVVNKFPHQLSGGQLQRFLIARALLLDVQVLVADEIIPRAVYPFHNARSIAGLLHKREIRDPLSRMCRRDGPDGAGLPPSAASIYEDAHGLCSTAGREMGMQRHRRDGPESRAFSAPQRMCLL